MLYNELYIINGWYSSISDMDVDCCSVLGKAHHSRTVLPETFFGCIECSKPVLLLMTKHKYSQYLSCSETPCGMSNIQRMAAEYSNHDAAGYLELLFKGCYKIKCCEMSYWYDLIIVHWSSINATCFLQCSSQDLPAVSSNFISILAMLQIYLLLMLGAITYCRHCSILKSLTVPKLAPIF
jgi:hypothetical protein